MAAEDNVPRLPTDAEQRELEKLRDKLEREKKILPHQGQHKKRK